LEAAVGLGTIVGLGTEVKSSLLAGPPVGVIVASNAGVGVVWQPISKTILTGISRVFFTIISLYDVLVMRKM
jgi:hypothetical protein